MRGDTVISARTRAYRVVILTLDSHAAGPCHRVAHRLERDFPGLSLTVHAAAEWGECPEALAEARRHADYVAFGPVFPTQRLSWNKPLQGLDALAAARRHAGDHPLVAIGGITAARLPRVRATGTTATGIHAVVVS